MEERKQEEGGGIQDERAEGKKGGVSGREREKTEELCSEIVEGVFDIRDGEERRVKDMKRREKRRVLRRRTTIIKRRRRRSQSQKEKKN
jgi:hypothetical protein